jgi:hypothetical protein
MILVGIPNTSQTISEVLSDSLFLDIAPKPQIIKMMKAPPQFNDFINFLNICFVFKDNGRLMVSHYRFYSPTLI